MSQFARLSRPFVGAIVVLVAGLTGYAAPPADEAPSSPEQRPPMLFLIGDSTVKNGTRGQRGWGEEVGRYFDPAKVTIVNAAIGGRSSRTFFTEGRWKAVEGRLKPGDAVIIQFGHNDGGDPRPDPNVRGTGRGSLRGTGEESLEVKDAASGKVEVVHSYGWYLRQYIRGARAKGAMSIVCSPVPRNDWKEGKVLRADRSYGGYARDVATAEQVVFVNLNEIVARRYEQLGREKVNAFFPDEHTHTNSAGAAVIAKGVIAGINGLKGSPVQQWLTAEGRAVEGSPEVIDAQVKAPVSEERR